MRGIVIGSTRSSCGKTTVTLGLLAALRKKGLTVQPFKAGPDFIRLGPAWRHREACLAQPQALDVRRRLRTRLLFSLRSKTDIAVVEGVMGLYDERSQRRHPEPRPRPPAVLVVRRLRHGGKRLRRSDRVQAMGAGSSQQCLPSRKGPRHLQPRALHAPLQSGSLGVSKECNRSAICRGKRP